MRLQLDGGDRFRRAHLLPQTGSAQSTPSLSLASALLGFGRLSTRAHATHPALCLRVSCVLHITGAQESEEAKFKRRRVGLLLRLFFAFDCRWLFPPFICSNCSSVSILLGSLCVESRFQLLYHSPFIPSLFTTSHCHLLPLSFSPYDRRRPCKTSRGRRQRAPSTPTSSAPTAEG